jgi:hypothetical protein
MTLQVEVGRIHLSDRALAEASQFLRAVFPHARHLTPAYLRWQYRGNPEGQALGFEARLEGRLIGHVAALPMTGEVEGTARRGALVVNGAVDPRYVRRSVISAITSRLYAQGPGDGFDFLVGVANANSTGAMRRNWKLIGPLDARIGIGRPARAASGGPAPSFRRLWSEEAIGWRLADPERRSRARMSRGTLELLAPSGRPGVAALLYDGPDEWGLAARAAGGGSPLRVWVGLDPSLNWARSRFIPIPRLLRPSPLNMFFKDLTGGGLAPDPARALFHAIDFDAF